MSDKEIIKLGTDEVFVLKDKAGEIRAFEHNLDLTSQNGGLIQPGKGKPFVISAQGYEMWAENAGACVIKPRKVVVDGQLKGNPCAVRDERGHITCVYTSAVAFRYSSKGIPQLSDWSIIFDLAQYKMIDLLAKAKRCPQAFKLLPMGKEASGDGTWAKYYFDDSTSLFVNTSHDEALTWYSEFRQREKNAVNLAQTFVKRNALKHLSGLQKSPTGPNWALKVLCWRPMNDSVIKWDETQYKALQDKVQEFTEGGNGFENAEITSGTENALEDEAFEVLEKDTDPEDSKPDDSGEPDKNTDASREENAALQASSEERKPEPEKPKPRDDLSEMEIIKNSLIMAQESFPEEFAEACTKSKVKPNTLASADPKTMNRDVCETIQKDVNQILDEKEL